MRKDRRNSRISPAVKQGLAIAAVLLFVGVVFFGIRSFLNNASYFQVKRITFVGLDKKSVAGLLSKQLMYDNIFRLDIARIAASFKRSYPQFHDVEIVRSLPDELIVKVMVRKPVAQLKEKDFFLIDNEGVIVSDGSHRPSGRYIIIQGLKGFAGLSFGKKIYSRELVCALQLAVLLQEYQAQLRQLIPFAERMDSFSVDAALYPSLYVCVDSLELRFHGDALPAQMASLLNVLPSLKDKIKQLKYIDLRFGDPAVSF